MKNLSFNEANAMAKEHMRVKGYDCLLINFDDAKGLSILVYKNGKHINYAVDDFEFLHERMVSENGIGALRQYYLDKVNKVLFTDDELMGNVASYDEFLRKEYFLRNYWIMQYEHTSTFSTAKEDIEELMRDKKIHPYYCAVCSCYVGDQAICNKANMYRDHLQGEYKKLQQSGDGFREIISYELSKFITGNADKALNALGLEYDTLSDWQKRILNQELKERYDVNITQKRENVITIKDFKMGGPAFIVNMNLGKKEAPSITETMVAGIGRVYVTTTTGRRFMEGTHEECLTEKVSFGTSDLLFNSRTAAEEYIEKNGLELWLGCISVDGAKRYTLQQLRAVKNILEPEKSDDSEELKDIMRECLETRGYIVTDEKLDELYSIYEDCQEWDDDEMLTGDSYLEVEDFVKHSSCVDEVLTGQLRYIKQEELPEYWEEKDICIEFGDGSDALAQENGYTLEQCMAMKGVRFFLD